MKSSPGQYAVYFHCQTDLVETFRELYPELVLAAIAPFVLDAAEKLPEAELRHCVALALTYHLRKRAKIADARRAARSIARRPRAPAGQ